MIAVVDYGVGNLFSIESSCSLLGAETAVTGDPEVLRKADRIILPGVGAFGDAADKLRATGLDRAVLEEAAAGKPLLGICLGMQLLFETGYEYGVHKGLGLIPGSVRAMEGTIPPELKIPQMGWNALRLKNGGGPLFRGIEEGGYVYFVHSYSAEECGPYITAVTEYGRDITAAVQRDNVYGTQFHPEKSGSVGLRILKNFCEL